MIIVVMSLIGWGLLGLVSGTVPGAELLPALLAQVQDNDAITDLLNQLTQATPLEAWQLGAGFFLPWFAGWLLKRQDLSSAQKSWAALALAAVVAVVGSWLAGDFTAVLTMAAVFKIASIAWATYIGFWKQTGLAPNAKRPT